MCTVCTLAPPSRARREHVQTDRQRHHSRGTCRADDVAARAAACSSPKRGQPAGEAGVTSLLAWRCGRARSAGRIPRAAVLLAGPKERDPRAGRAGLVHGSGATRERVHASAPGGRPARRKEATLPATPLFPFILLHLSHSCNALLRVHAPETPPPTCACAARPGRGGARCGCREA